MEEQRARPDLGRMLDRLSAELNVEAARARDPVSRVWRAQGGREKQELVALIASSLAYGRVGLVRRAIDDALARLGGRPGRALEELGAARLAAKLDGFVYRMTRGADLADLIVGAARAQRRFGSLERAFLGARSGDQAERLGAMRAAILEGRLRSGIARGLGYLLPDPARGSACKRLHLFARWMARGPDGIDLGLWREVDAASLWMPLDTHTARICRYLGLTERSRADAVAAREVAGRLKRFDARDPLRFDFPICHLGIAGDCVHRYDAPRCARCPLFGGCAIATPGRPP